MIHHSDKEVLMKEDVAEFLGLSPRQVGRLIKDDGLPVVMLRSSVRILKKDLMKWLEEKSKPITNGTVSPDLDGTG